MPRDLQRPWLCAHALSALGFALVLVSTAPPPARADTGTDTCELGPVEAMFLAFIQAVDQRFFKGHNAGLAWTISHCQFRLFWGFRTFCFSEDDYFLGSVNFFGTIDPQNDPDNWSVGESVEDIETFTIDVELVTYGEEGSTSEWLDVSQTSVHAGRRPDFGPVIMRHQGVFLKLPPGDYAVITHSQYPGDAADPPWPGCDTAGNCVWDPVYVRVFSAEDAALLGPPPAGTFGNVACPEE